jgi:parallel beta-helix repeat protein
MGYMIMKKQNNKIGLLKASIAVIITLALTTPSAAVIIDNAPENEPLDYFGEPKYPTPGNGATDVGINDNLNFFCREDDEPDGGPSKLTYHIHFGNTAPPPLWKTDENVNDWWSPWYEPGTLEYDTIYYWNVTAINKTGEIRKGDLWSFTTEAKMQPNVPSNPFPIDGSEAAIDMDLGWEGGDPNKYEEVTYRVYLDNSSPPSTKIGETDPLPSNQTEITFPLPMVLEYGTTYYWNITAVDTEGLTRGGPIWNFTTVRAPMTIYVDDDFVDDPPNHKWDTIQEGIDDAGVVHHDIISIYSGTYTEQIIINKLVHLVGENRETVIVDGDGSKIFEVTSDDFSIENLTIQNSSEGIKVKGDAATISNCNFRDNSRSIILWSSHGHTIINCDIGPNGFGFYLSSSGGNRYIDCDIHDNDKSIHALGLTDNHFENCNFYDNGGSGIALSGMDNTLMNCHAYGNSGIGFEVTGSRNTITDCSSYGNGAHGIKLGSENTVENCEFTDNNDSGIYISGGDNMITDCLIEGNLLYGFKIPGLSTEPGKGGNMIYHNNILNSEGSAENAYVNETDPARQTWDDDVGIGNFWDDHPGGNHSFGIYETEYRIGTRNKDRYPLVSYPYVPDTTAPELTISVPEEGTVYFRGNPLFTLPGLKMAVIISDITYEAEASDESDIARVEFTYTTAGIPDHIDYEPPYTWELNESRIETPDTPLHIRAVDTWGHYTNMTVDTLVINLGIL